MRYVLEIKDWQDWEEERTFDTLESAYAYATNCFSHNFWRIIDGFVSDEILFEYDPTVSFELSATQDIDRFARTDRWMTQRAAAQRMSQRQRMGEIASRQRRENGQTRFFTSYMEDLDDVVVKYEKVDWRKEGF